MSQQYSIKFIKRERLSQDAYAFYFERPKDLDFVPGKFLKITLDIPNPDSRGTSRFFSITSSPTEVEHLIIATRIIQSSFKKALLELDQKSQILITAPLGNFIFKEVEKDPHVFLAGGIGITPFRSMIRFATDKNLKIPITLFTSFSTTQDMMFHDELQDIVKNNSWLKLVETVTKPEESKSSWEGLTGRIDRPLLQSSILNLPSSIFYICGPPSMVEGLRNVVKSLGVNDDKVLIERFTGY